MKVFTYIEIDDSVLFLLLKDMTTKKNIIFATSDYDELDTNINCEAQISKNIISKYKNYIIKPRVMRTAEVQNKRTKDKAEVFTPSWLCNQMNNYLDDEWFGKKNIFNKIKNKNWVTNLNKIQFSKEKSWKDYIKSKRIEITCGEAPYIVSRYDTTTGEYIEIKNRIGMLDRKLRVINENTKDINEWKKWVIEAYKNVYGYEFQGDSLLIARINLYLTYEEYLYEIWNEKPKSEDIKQICKIINWNIWQMDGITCNIPLVKRTDAMQMTLFEYFDNDKNVESTKEIVETECMIYDWNKNKKIKFKDIKRR